MGGTGYQPVFSGNLPLKVVWLASLPNKLSSLGSSRKHLQNPLVTEGRLED